MKNKRDIFSIFVIFIIIGSSIIYTSKANDSTIILKENKNEEWFDGYFEGSLGKTKNSIDGFIKGNINLGRSDDVGKFFGTWNKTESKYYGEIKGIFRNNIITGFIKTNEKLAPRFFIGYITHDKTNFQTSIFSLYTDIKFIRGTFEVSFLPPLTGIHGVGTKEMHLIDENRSEEFTDNPDDHREMMIRIWYPINKEIKEPIQEYMDQPTFLWLKNRSPLPLFTIPDTAYKFVRPHGIKDAAISEKEGKYPVIIFSPGYDGVYQIYTSLIEDLVSNGFIVVSINHPYVSGITVFPDGRKIYVASNSTGLIGLNSVVGDAKFVLDEITRLNKSDEKFKGKFDLSKVGMYGHSFGGASTAICCYDEDRILCGLTLDGVFYTNYTKNGIEKPFLMMLAERRFNDENAEEMWELLYDDSYKVEVLGSTHYAYSDVGLLLNHLTPLIPNNILGFGTIEPKLHVNITKRFELAFFEVYLKNKSPQRIIDLASKIKEINFEYK